MNTINNITELDYQGWKKTINQIILYKHFKEEAEKANEEVKVKMSEYNESIEKTPEQIQQYTVLLDQLFLNSTGIYKKVEENINNKELLNTLYNQKNIDVSEASYKRWLETGEKIKI